MDTFCYMFSDCIWLPLLELFILFVFCLSVFRDIGAMMRRGGTHLTVKRGEKSWTTFIAFWSLSIIIVEVIVSSDLVSDHKIIVGLINVGMLVYLNLLSGYFQNKIIGWAIKLQKRET